MKKFNYLVSSYLLLHIAFSQPFSIGHKQITFTDPARSNRSILTEIYYPSTSSGDNTPIANGTFPVIVFGHGFVMSWDAYKCFWDTLVPMGYILVFPRTEGSISPNHNEFALDLRFLNEKMKAENTNPSSFFYQRISNKSAIMGHSMGGGCSFLAAASYTGSTTLVNFAAANTNPSSIVAAKNVTIPLLMFIGQNDGVTPPNQHQIPMFDSCASSCKTRVTILGGGHCYFADYNFNCSFGEGTTSPQPNITRAEQQRRVFHILKPYLNYILKNSSTDSILFINRLQNNSEFNYVRQCSTLTILNEHNNFSRDWTVAPNPFEDKLVFNFYKNKTYNVRISSLDGHWVFQLVTTQKTLEIPTSKLKNGIYIVSVNGQSVKLLKQ